MKDNIALIGFMGSGKTTVGKHLAKAMEMKFVDTDKVISAREKKSLNEIFDEKGKKYFCDLEREIIAEEALKNNCVIATGGDSIIDNENIKRLKETSFVVYLECTIDCLYERLKNNTTRPTLRLDPNSTESKRDLIIELYEQKRFLYEISADFKVEINEKSNIFDTVNKIKEMYINS